MLIEHKPSGEPYTLAGLWHFKDSQSEFVAAAHWRKWTSESTGFSGGANRLQTVASAYAECDSLAELQQWAAQQISNGASFCNIHRTWIDRTGRRENAFVERLGA